MTQKHTLAPGETLSTKYIYGCLRLDDTSKKSLSSMFEMEARTAFSDAIDTMIRDCDHVTVAFGSTLDIPLFRDWIIENYGSKIEVTVIGVGIGDGIMALAVQFDGPCANKIPHITYMRRPEVKPVMSNQIPVWHAIVGKPVRFFATVDLQLKKQVGLPKEVHNV